MELKWIRRFLDLAEYISKWSKDPSTKVGAVIVDRNRRIVSTGYNGFARDVQDLKERLDDRETKYKIVLHAEENAIMYAKQNLENCSLFVSKMPPCSHCASLIIQSGIKNVYVYDDVFPERWMQHIDMTTQMFHESGVTLTFVKRGSVNSMPG